MPEPTNPFEMKCDTPFVFVLTGSSGDILFTGAVNQP
jgi:serine protease inhibitor